MTRATFLDCPAHEWRWIPTWGDVGFDECDCGATRGSALWFIDGGKARIAVDGELHEFRLIDALAFAGEDVFAGHETAKPALRRLNGDATNLVKLQKAMGAEAIEVAQAERGAVFVVPLDKAGIQPVGKMVLFNSIEDGA